MGESAQLGCAVAALWLATACSGFGVSTTARTAGGEGDSGDQVAQTGTAPGMDEQGNGAEGAGTTTIDPPPETTGAESGGGKAESSEGGPACECLQDSLQGGWVSEGENLAPLLVELTGAVRIAATFAEPTFTVTTLDQEGQETTQAGVYASMPSEVEGIYTIVLEQSMPSAITVEGIYAIDTSTCPPRMTYEVVQTMPSVGAEPPTPQGGFGSTSNGPELTQHFVGIEDGCP